MGRKVAAVDVIDVIADPNRLCVSWQEEVNTTAASDGVKKRKRSRGEGTNCGSAAEADAATSAGNRKQIVRIRAKVHCTAAGMPDEDAPCEREGEDDGGDDATHLPKWHPLEKVCRV